jgi:hypothetical protein
MVVVALNEEAGCAGTSKVEADAGSASMSDTEKTPD